MTARLPEEIRSALQTQGGSPLELVDPATNKRYVLLPADLYERLSLVVEDSLLSAEEQAFLLREAGRRVGWDDPAMDAYDRYDEERARLS